MRNLIYFTECLSTNDAILPFLTAKDEHLVGVYTFNQKKGRGQYGNSWETSCNENIAFSLAIPTAFVNVPDPLFNFYTALLLRNFVANLTQKNIEIKWPNDLILNHKKIAGILTEKIRIENRSYFILGFGLNVLQKDFQKYSSGSSLKIETEQEFNLNVVSEKLFSFLTDQLNLNRALSFKISDYEAHLYKKDKIAVFISHNRRQNGIIKKVDAEGFLHIDLEHDGLQKFYHKEIKMLY